jgi:TatD DNase family protein
LNPALIDSHCHLDLEPLISDISSILQDAAVVGVHGFVVPGVHPDGWPGIAALAVAYPQVFPAFGVHPMHAESVTDQLLEQLLELAPQGVAIGEIGLDSACQAPMSLQEQAFREQLRIAVRHGLPVLIHCRREFQRTLEILREEQVDQIGGIMHAYSGSVEMAREFIQLGFDISISGTVTWSNAVKPLRVARELPLEHLVLETDAPDMTPERYRGVFNRPAWISETAQKLAELREVSLEDIARATSENIRRVLRLGTGSA